MNLRRTIAFVSLGALTLVATACAANVDGTGSTSSAIDPAIASTTPSSSSDAPRPPPILFAHVLDARTAIADPSAKPADFVLPFLAPPPPKEGDAPATSCVVLRPKGDAPTPPAPPAPSADAPKDPAAPPPDDAPHGPLFLQVAILASDADATPGPDGKAPIAVMQCVGAPDATSVAITSDALSDLLSDAPSGAVARIALAAFPPPPKDAPSTAPSTGAPPAPLPMGRGVFTVATADASSISDAAATLALPK